MGLPIACEGQKGELSGGMTWPRRRQFHTDIQNAVACMDMEIGDFARKPVRFTETPCNKKPVFGNS